MTARRILVTGMSGVGKSAVTEELSRRGLWTVDLDDPAWSAWTDADPDDPMLPRLGQDWRWQLDKVRGLLASRPDETLVVSGCSENMGEVLDRFDLAILLSSPIDVMLARVAQRGAGGFGHGKAEREQIALAKATVEPLLRKRCRIEISSDAPLPVTVDKVVAAINSID